MPASSTVPSATAMPRAAKAWSDYQFGPATPPPECSEETLNSDAIPADATPVVAVIGCGYVGSHLVQIFGHHFDVVAFDVSAPRIKIFSQEVADYPSIRCTTDASLLRGATHFLISVPTLLSANKQAVDTTHVRSAIATVIEHARVGATIVIESSVAVGMTRSLLESLTLPRGIHAGMSPERVDPGRVWPALEDVPKIISGLDAASLASIERIYSKAFNKLVCVSSPEVAEMTKLYENCQRMVCIAFANEMSDACEKHGVDAYEVSRAAASKPFGFMPYTPSLGVGGHCIPVNPSYLFTNNDMPVLRLANDNTQGRPAAMADKIIAESKIHNPRVLVIGAAFKPGQSVISCSPTILFAERLKELEIACQYVDPLVPQTMVPAIAKFDEKAFNAAAIDENFDIVVIGMKQTGLDYSQLNCLRHAQVKSFVDMEQEAPSFMRRESRCR